MFIFLTEINAHFTNLDEPPYSEKASSVTIKGILLTDKK